MPVKYQLSQKGTPPSTDTPSTLDALLTEIRQYTEISTNSDDPDSDTVRSILVQPTEPTGASASDLWVKVNAITRRPIGLFAYSGSSWRSVNLTNSGVSNDRPTDAVAGETYYDTEINVMLVYTGSAWVTQDGSPGDMKYVYIDSTTYTTFALGKDRAEYLNPGWEYASDAEGCVLVGTNQGDSDNDYLTAGNTFGTKDHTLSRAELPTDQIEGKCYSPADGTYQPITRTGLGTTNYHENAAHTSNTGSAFDLQGPVVLDALGDGDAHENRQPSYTAFLLRKLGY